MNQNENNENAITLQQLNESPDFELSLEPETGSSAATPLPLSAESFSAAIENATELHFNSYGTAYADGCICCPETDEHWYKFTTPQSSNEKENYTIYTTGELNTVGQLYDCCGNFMEEVDDRAECGDINFRIVCDLDTNTTYYVRVTEKNSNIGNYTLMITTRRLVDYVKINDGSNTAIVLEKGKTYLLPMSPNYNYPSVAGAESLKPFTVSLSPTDATEQTVIWFATDSSVISVQSGATEDNITYQAVTANNTGIAKLYAYDRLQHGQSAWTYVAVVNPGEDLVKATKITLDKSKLELEVGESGTLTATISPKNATGQKVDWVSKDDSIALVNPNGVVTAKKPGTTTIYAKAMDGSGVVAECKVSVKGYYYIVNPKTNKVVNILGSYLVDLANGKEITLYDKSGSNEQIWRIDNISDQEECFIKSYVDQAYGFNAYRSPTNNYNCNIRAIEGNETDAAVHFVLQDNGYYKIELANYPGYFLTATGSENGDDIRWQTANQGDFQYWYLEIADLSERQSIAETVVSKVQNCSTDLIPSNKKTASVAVAQAMLDLGYPVSFVAGMLGNIVFEGSTGQFENSNYANNPEKKKDYLIYMDTEYNGTDFYLNNYSNKTIMEVGVDSTYNMLCDLENKSNGTWKIDGSRVGFGLGCIQWTAERTLALVNAYREINNCSDVITTGQACQGESLLMLRELGSPEYNSIISSWKTSNSGLLDSTSAASSAGQALCESYIRPSDPTGSLASTRANRAASIYSAIAI